MITETQVGACPCCGAREGEALAQAPALLAVADVLVFRVLEGIGKRIVRCDRSRFEQMDGRPHHVQWHLAHTKWEPDTAMIDKGLIGAWDVVPAMLTSHGCCGVQADQVVQMLDDYVRDLLITRTPHNLHDLRYRFEKFLGVPLVEPPEYGAA